MIFTIQMIHQSLFSKAEAKELKEKHELQNYEEESSSWRGFHRCGGNAKIAILPAVYAAL